MLTATEVGISGEKATAFFPSKAYALWRTANVYWNSGHRNSNIMINNFEYKCRNKLDTENKY